MAEKELEELPQDRVMFTLNEKNYYLDSLSEQAQGLIRNVTTIEGELVKYQLSADIAKLAKASLMTQLESQADTFENVPDPEGSVPEEVEKSA